MINTGTAIFRPTFQSSATQMMLHVCDMENIILLVHFCMFLHGFFLFCICFGRLERDQMQGYGGMSVLIASPSPAVDHKSHSTTSGGEVMFGINHNAFGHMVHNVYICVYIYRNNRKHIHGVHPADEVRWILSPCVPNTRHNIDQFHSFWCFTLCRVQVFACHVGISDP